MINIYELEKYSATYSVERLKSFIYSDQDKLEDIIQHYSDNMQISQALYPELCTLEVVLRNAINTALKTHISETWIENEISNQSLLADYDYNTLVKTYNDTKAECHLNHKDFTIGKVIANLNFGFWTNLCVKSYNSKIWNKKQCFYGVFVHFPHKKYTINGISQQLYLIRRLRNRIFHYEKIFKHPNRTLALYNTIQEILSYLPQDELKILSKNSTFMDTYNKLINLSNNK